MTHWTLEVLLLGLGIAALILLLPSAIWVVYDVRKSSSAGTAPAGNPSNDSKDNPGTLFSVRYQGPSYAVFKPGCCIRVVHLAVAGGAADVELSTEYLDGWGPVQNAIVASAKGSAEEIDSSLSSLSDRLADLAAVVSLSANVWVGDLEISREPDEPSDALDSNALREIDEVATGVLLERLGGHPEAETLREVLHCYRRALSFWSPERQAVALAHLHGGLQKMTAVLIGSLAQNSGIPRSGVAKLLGVSQEDLPARILESELYRDDSLCLHASRLACEAVASGSDSDESESYVVDDAHLSAARYLRNAIFRVLELEPSCHARLLGAMYDTPIGLGETTITENVRRQDRFANPLAVPRRQPQFRAGMGS